jgi:putative transposase
VILGHTIRLVPTTVQEEYFVRACGTARFAYNWALSEWNRLYNLGEKPNGASLKKAFNALRGVTYPWTYEVHRDCTAQPFANLQKAFVAFFRKEKKHPRFHKRGRRDSFYVANDKLSFDDYKVRIPVLGWVRMRENVRFEGKIVSATVKRVADRWQISVKVDVGEFHKERESNGEIGVDLGITTLATLSTGEKITGPKALMYGLKKLQRLSRSHSRKVKGSSNRGKAAKKLAKHHCRIADIRQNALHDLTTRLCRENQTVTIEDLNVKGMMRNHKLARALSDASFGAFREQMTYKSVIYGTDLRTADRWFPSSKKCSRCGAVKESLGLKERLYICESCGFVIDRDHNAALNLRQLPKVIREVTPVETIALTRKRVKLSSKKQEFQSEYLCSLRK